MQQARAIEEAKQRLEQSLVECVNNHLASHPAPIEVNVSFDETEREPEADTSEEAALTKQIRQLVELFHKHDAVQRSGIEVRHVTAIDSNGDGQAAVNVRYVYPDEG